MNAIHTTVVLSCWVHYSAPQASVRCMILYWQLSRSIVSVPICPTEKGYYEYYHNASSRMCLRLELDNAADWTTAQDNCQLDGGHLAVFETDQEFTDIVDYISNVRGTDGRHSSGNPTRKMNSKLFERTSAKCTRNVLQTFSPRSQRITTE